MLFEKERIHKEECEWDILHSACKDCYINNLECLHYQNQCRKEVKSE